MKQGMRHIYFLGIGGIGMSALARYYKHQGAEVYGYDLTSSPLTKQLEKEGMAIHYEDSPNLLPPLIDVVVYTPAVPKNLKELEALRQRNIPILKRAEALGEISKSHFTIAIAGTHGKTTTTAMVSHILKECGINFTAFIGGIAKGFNSNLHLGDGNEKILVVEADEFDHSFLHLEPNVSIVTSIDADHLDIYGDKQHLIDSFNEFVNNTDENGLVIYKNGLPINTDNKALCFGFDENSDCYASDIRHKEGETLYKMHCADGKEIDIDLPLAGRHNIMNATAAFIACQSLNIKAEDIARAFGSYQGVSRRFDIRVKNSKHCYIDDYAHHPEEIKSSLSAIRESFPDKRLTVIFQPHLFTRTRDFMEEFARSLSMADELILLDIYPAREKPIEGITSEALMEKIQLDDKQICSKSELLDLINQRKPELLVTMGAGDIDRFVQPLENLIKTW